MKTHSPSPYYLSLQLVQLQILTAAYSATSSQCYYIINFLFLSTGSTLTLVATTFGNGIPLMNENIHYPDNLAVIAIYVRTSYMQFSSPATPSWRLAHL